MIDDVRADRIKCVSKLPRFGHASSQNPSEDKSKGQMSPWELRVHSCRDHNLFCRYSLLTSRKNRKTCGDSSSHNIWISGQVCICEATILAPNQPRSLKYDRDWTYAEMVWEAEPSGAFLPEYWAQHTGAKRPCITPVLKDVTSTVKQLFGTSAPVKKRASWILTLPPTVCMRSVSHDWSCLEPLEGKMLPSHLFRTLLYQLPVGTRSLSLISQERPLTGRFMGFWSESDQECKDLVAAAFH